MSKKEIASELYKVLENEDCDECPLKEICDLAENEEYGSICRVLDVERIK